MHTGSPSIATGIASTASALAGAHAITNALPCRDIKPENFLLTDKSEAARLKLCDFGLSSYWRPGVRLNSIVGSCYYVAPEVRHAPKHTAAQLL